MKSLRVLWRFNAAQTKVMLFIYNFRAGCRSRCAGRDSNPKNQGGYLRCYNIKNPPSRHASRKALATGSRAARIAGNKLPMKPITIASSSAVMIRLGVTAKLKAIMAPLVLVLA